jgi:hypothetical protein
MPVPRGDQADLVRNDCGAVTHILPGDEVEATVLRMAMAGGMCSETCPHCGEVNTFPGWTSIDAYTCRHCGEGVVVPTRAQ